MFRIEKVTHLIVKELLAEGRERELSGVVVEIQLEEDAFQKRRVVRSQNVLCQHPRDRHIDRELEIQRHLSTEN